MKRSLAAVLFIALLSTGFFGCDKQLENSITLRNLASGAIYMNFRGEVVKVPSGQTVVIKAIPVGVFNYATTFEVPANASGATFSGDATGTLDVKAASKILILYSSTLINGNYTLFATISSSDDQTPDDTPTGP